MNSCQIRKSCISFLFMFMLCLYPGWQNDAQAQFQSTQVPTDYLGAGGEYRGPGDLVPPNIPPPGSDEWWGARPVECTFLYTNDGGGGDPSCKDDGNGGFENVVELQSNYFGRTKFRNWVVNGRTFYGWGDLSTVTINEVLDACRSNPDKEYVDVLAGGGGLGSKVLSDKARVYTHNAFAAWRATAYTKKRDKCTEALRDDPFSYEIIANPSPEDIDYDAHGSNPPIDEDCDAPFCSNAHWGMPESTSFARRNRIAESVADQYTFDGKSDIHDQKPNDPGKVIDRARVRHSCTCLLGIADLNNYYAGYDYMSEIGDQDAVVVGYIHTKP